MADAVLRGFRVHLLLPNELATAIQAYRDLSPGLTLVGNEYQRKGKPVLRVHREPIQHGERFHVSALTELWVQEPGLTIVRPKGGEWRAFGPSRWVATTRGIEGWLPLDLRDAHTATVHFSRVKTNPNYCVGVAHRESGSDEKRFRSDGGFTKLLDTPARATELREAIEGASIFDRGANLIGLWPRPANSPPLRQWELAGHPDEDWLHFIGWKGGAAAVVTERGRDDGFPADRYLCVYAWRRMRPGESISQTLTMRRFAV